jgi:hypothetical protein
MEKLIKFQGHNITYPMALPIMCNGVSWSRSGKGKLQIRCLLALPYYDEKQPHLQTSQNYHMHKAFVLLSP